MTERKVKRVKRNGTKLFQGDFFMRNKLFYLALCLTAALLVGCSGSSSSSSPALGSGSTTFTVSDTDPSTLDSFTVTIEAVDIISDGGTPYHVFPSPKYPASRITVDLVKYRRGSQILGVRNLPEGTYSRATITISSGVPAIAS